METALGRLMEVHKRRVRADYEAPPPRSAMLQKEIVNRMRSRAENEQDIWTGKKLEGKDLVHCRRLHNGLEEEPNSSY